MLRGNLLIHRELTVYARFVSLRASVNGVGLRRFVSGALEVCTDPGAQTLALRIPGCETTELRIETDDESVVLVKVKAGTSTQSGALAGAMGRTRPPVAATATEYTSFDAAFSAVQATKHPASRGKWSALLFAFVAIVLFVFGAFWFQILLAIVSIVIIGEWAVTRWRANRIVGSRDVRGERRLPAQLTVESLGEEIARPAGAAREADGEPIEQSPRGQGPTDDFSDLEHVADVVFRSFFLRRVASTPAAEAVMSVDVDGATPVELTLQRPVARVHTSEDNPTVTIHVTGLASTEYEINVARHDVPVLDVWVDLVRVGLLQCTPELRAEESAPSSEGEAPGQSILTVGSPPTLSSVRAAFPGPIRLVIAILGLLVGIASLVLLICLLPTGDWVESAFGLSVLTTTAGLIETERSWRLRRMLHRGENG